MLLHCPAVSDAATDLVHHLQRRSLLEQQQRMARAGYAYGVDLRRAYWLGTSSLTRPLVGAADRRWAELTSRLQRDALLPPERTPAKLLREVTEAAAVLRAPVPTVRALAPRVTAREPWPTALPIGTTHGSVTWLVLDPERVARLSPAARRFVLTSALAHLQCDHGTLFTLHLLTRGRSRAARSVRRVLAPWSKVAIFSADRAGLLAAVDLELVVRTLEEEARHEREIPWWPAFPDARVRTEALRDFDHSAVMARARRLHERARRARADAQAFVDAQAAVDDEGAMTDAAADDDAAVEASEGGSTRAGAEGETKTAAGRAAMHAVNDGEALAAGAGAGEGPEARTGEAATATEAEPTPLEPEGPEVGVPSGPGWSLARCDARLTRRLGLL